MSIRILVIDDELSRLAHQREAFLARWNLFPESRFAPPVEYTFISSQHQHTDHIVNDPELAVRCVAGDPGAWALVLLDMQFDHGPLLNGEPVEADPQFGLRIQAELERRFPDLPIVQFTAQAQKDLGRQDGFYLSKIDGTLDDLRLALVERGRVARADRLRLLRVPDDTVIASQAMISLYAEVYRRARADAPVLLRGATGTGKEHIARYFHAVSPHAGSELVAVQVSSIPAALYESELFGHEKGAFTGAERAHEGMFARAGNGTLFLDEIGALPQDLQSKLLRVLGERAFRKVGGRIDAIVRCGVIAATQDDLEANGFRPDLLARFVTIVIPDLSRRQEEIVPIAERFLGQMQARAGKRGMVLSAEAAEALHRHEWPDNARGIKAVIERAVLQLSSNSVVQPRHLGLAVADGGRPSVSQQPRLQATGQSPAQPGVVTERVSVQDVLQSFNEAGVPADAGPLRGALERCESAFDHIRRELAFAALQCCRHPVSGKIRILPAMQLITGDEALSPLRARRKLNQILGRRQNETVDLLEIASALGQRYGMRGGEAVATAVRAREER